MLFQQHEPLYELKQLQNQIDRSRSTVLVCAMSLQLLIALILIYWIIVLFCYIKNRHVHLKYSELKNFLFLIVLLIVARECNSICQLNYNERAFGYYISNIRELENNRELYNEFKREKGDMEN